MPALASRGDLREEPPNVETHRRYRWPLIGAFFLLFLLPGAIKVAGSGRPLWQVGLLLAGFAVYAVGYLVLPPVALHASLRRRAVVSGVMLALGGSLVLGLAAAGLASGSVGVLVYAAAVSGLLLPRRTGLVVNGAVLLLLVVTLLVLRIGTEWNSVLSLLSVSVAMVFMGELIRKNSQLRQARDEVTRLAVAEERARFARDLHDVLGHSLTTITIKAGLARRVLESGAPRERAISEVRDVEQLARQALAEVRATVSGYRRVSLAAELAGARAALHAARIEAELPQAVDDVPVEMREVFAYVLREGVTNVLRHSGATRCAVRLGVNWLEIHDNGRGETSAGEASGQGSGHGLPGLRERLAEVGGELEAGGTPRGGFRVRAHVPRPVDRPSAPGPASGSDTVAAPQGRPA